MMKKNFPVILVLLAICSSCCVQRNQVPFQLKGAYYQSWMESARNKGTRVTITLKEVSKSVTFDSIVFRSAKVPVSFKLHSDSVVITGIIPAEGAVTPIIPQYTDEANQLIYRYNGSRGTLPLKNVKRTNMDYLTK